MISYFKPALWIAAFQELMFRNYSSSCNFPNFILFSPLTGNDLEALQIHLCILASDFTIEGQPSLGSTSRYCYKETATSANRRKGGEDL